MKRDRSQGFSLIELMIVVAILGILAATAFFEYQSYTKRARVAEGLYLAGEAKAAVGDYYSVNNIWPGGNPVAGLVSSSSITGGAVSSINVGANGTVTITYNAKVATGQTIVLTPDASKGGSITWSCTGNTATVGGSVLDKWRPTSCR